MPLININGCHIILVHPAKEVINSLPSESLPLGLRSPERKVNMIYFLQQGSNFSLKIKDLLRDKNKRTQTLTFKQKMVNWFYRLVGILKSIENRCYKGKDKIICTSMFVNCLSLKVFSYHWRCPCLQRF